MGVLDDAQPTESYQPGAKQTNQKINCKEKFFLNRAISSISEHLCDDIDELLSICLHVIVMVL